VAATTTLQHLGNVGEFYLSKCIMKQHRHLPPLRETFRPGRSKGSQLNQHFFFYIQFFRMTAVQLGVGEGTEAAANV